MQIDDSNEIRVVHPGDQDLQSEVSMIRANTVAKKSKDTYRNSIAKCLLWFDQHKPEILENCFKSEFEQHVDAEQRVTHESKHCLKWIMWKQK